MCSRQGTNEEDFIRTSLGVSSMKNSIFLDHDTTLEIARSESLFDRVPMLRGFKRAIKDVMAGHMDPSDVCCCSLKQLRQDMVVSMLRRGLAFAAWFKPQELDGAFEALEETFGYRPRELRLLYYNREAGETQILAIRPTNEQSPEACTLRS